MDRNKGKGKQGTKKAFLVFAAAMFLFMTGIGGAFADYTIKLIEWREHYLSRYRSWQPLRGPLPDQCQWGALYPHDLR